MKIKGLVDEDFSNYKLPSMFIVTSRCSFKCDAECGQAVCQNLPLATAPIIKVSAEQLVKRYLDNDITKAIVIGGLEPFDTMNDLFEVLDAFRAKCEDDIVIYTGYTEGELSGIIGCIRENYPNIIIKFGRFIPDQSKHYDEVLGVELASDNQYAKKIS